MNRPGPELAVLPSPASPSSRAMSAGPTTDAGVSAAQASWRVAHLLRKCDPTEWGGTESAIERLCQGLQHHGIEPVLFCPRLEHHRLAGEPWAELGWTVRRFRALVPVWGLSASARRQMIRVGGNLISFQLLAQLWREPGLKLIHTHTLGRLGGIALTIARARKLPFVVSIHGGLLDVPAGVIDGAGREDTSGIEWGRIFGLLLRSRRLLHDASAIITCNPTEAELLRRQNPTKRIVVQPHGIPVEQYRVDHRSAAWEAYPEVKGRPTLLCAGRIDPVKNQAWLVEQWPGIIRRHPRALLVLAGACTDPLYGDALNQRIRELRLSEHVLMPGGLPSKDPRLLGLFQDARALVLPSRSETFGLVLLEAWAAGSAVIASRTSGALALIEPGRNGWLFDLADPDAFGRAVDDVLMKPELRAQTVTRGQSVVQEHDQMTVAGRMKTLYQQLTEEHDALRGLARR